MKPHLRLFIFFVLFIAPVLTIAQQSTRTNSNCPGVPGACGYPAPSTLHSGPTPTPQNGNGTLGVIYSQTKCGLNFSTASQRLGRRGSLNGIIQPAPFVIGGIPAGAVIEKAYLWAEGSGNGAAQTATINGPLGSASYPMAIVGQGPDKCWGYAGSYTYRADVTASVNGNATYSISGLLTNPPTAGNDMDGATLLVVWSDAAQIYRGTIILADGAKVINGGTTTYTMPYPAVCGPTTGAQAFFGVGDIQFNPNSWSANGTPAPLSWNWWNFVQVATTVTVGQTSSNYTISSSGDCYNLCISGLYYRTTCVSCLACTLTLTNSTNVSCNGQCNGTATMTATGVAPFTFSWSPAATSTTVGAVNTATGLCAGLYTCTSTDASGCISTQTVNITQPTALNGTFAQTNVSCNAGTNGTASITMSGGVPGYTFAWSPAVTNSTVGVTNTATGLAAGTYVVTATDVNGCTYPHTFTITQPTALSSTFSQVNVLCNAASTGSATITMSGGTSPYTFTWSPAATNSTVGNTNTATGLAANTYVVTATDANGCTYPHTFVITQPPPLVIVPSQTNVTCNGACNGSATVTVSGGPAPYSYAWSPSGGTGSTASPLCAGNYTCTVTDANGCIGTQTFLITEPSAITATTSFVTSTCGNPNGSATVNPSGGVPTYSVVWTPGNQTTLTAVNLLGGVYTCVITDANLCTFTVTVTVPSAASPTLAITGSTNVTCFGACDGNATVTASGGTIPYSYSWAPSGGTGTTETGLCPGTYTCTVTDANGCTATATVLITEPPALAITPSQVDLLCNGVCNGSATVSVSGGTPGYTYLWSPSGGTGSIASSLCAGNYSCLVTDLNGCTLTQTFTITEPSLLTVASAGFNVSCFGSCDGQIVAIPTGGTPNYTFSWSPGCTSASCSNVCAGTYVVTVTDLNGCMASSTATVTEPPQIVITTSTISAHCNLPDGSASALYSGGTGTLSPVWYTPTPSAGANVNNVVPGNYYVVVTDLSGCSDTAYATVGNIPGVVGSPGTVTPVSCFGGNDGAATVNASGGTGTITYAWTCSGSTTNTANNLSAGNCSVTLTDSAGCTSTVGFVINQPTQLSITANANPAAVCIGQGITLTGTGNGGTPGYNYLWLPFNLPGAVQNINPTVSGPATVIVTDANGCIDSTTVNISVNPNPVAMLSGDSLAGCAAHCLNFSDLSTISAGTITGWSWDFGDGNTSTQQNPSHCYLLAGNYSVILTVTTSSGCSGTVTMPNYITAYANPIAEFSANPQPTTELNPVIYFTDLSVGATIWNWSFGDITGGSSTVQNPTFDYGGPGCFDALLTVSTPNGCIDTTVHPICIDPDVTLFVPNAFSPNGDGVNDFFFPQGIGMDPDKFEMWIFDRWGNMIFYTDDFNKQWDGAVQGKGGDLAQQDEYVWKIKAIDLLGNKRNILGHVALIR